MEGTKIAGYGLSVAGLILLVFSNTIAQLPILAKLGKNPLIYPVVAAVVLVAVGIVLIVSKSTGSSKVKHAAEEVPIYEGTGKKRRIVGYQKA